MDNEKLKQKLSTFEVRGTYWCMCDLLKLYDYENGQEIQDDEYYLLYIRKLKERYEKEVIVDNRNIKQIDLEDSINEIKNGKKD